jgi:16S rRNA (cytosine967-C5)-methyltransferase
MANRGAILACDSEPARLQRAGPRLKRAGVSIVQPRPISAGREAEALADWQDRADVVLVDAPCSSSGTWRRNPEARWRLTPERLARLGELQSHLLDLASTLVKPEGRLVYAVCSLFHAEGRDQAEAFGARSCWPADDLNMTAGRPAGTGQLLSPARDGTDGFFIARWRRPC